MPLSESSAAKLRAVIAEVAPLMSGLSGTEQACVLGGACERAGINPTWGELVAFLQAEPVRGPTERGGRHRILSTNTPSACPACARVVEGYERGTL